MRTGQRCFWAENDLCSACRVWRPLNTLIARPGHVFIREPGGEERSWRFRSYRRGSSTPSGIDGRWQVANEYGFRNARLPTEGEWAPSPPLSNPPLNHTRGRFPKPEQRTPEMTTADAIHELSDGDIEAISEQAREAAIHAVQPWLYTNPYPPTTAKAVFFDQCFVGHYAHENGK
jgi:hypothetical protein